MKSKEKLPSSDQIAADTWARNRDDLRNLLLHRSRTADVDDLMQTVFVRLLSCRSLHLVKNPRLYIYCVARTVLRDYQRHRAHAVPLQGSFQAEPTDETYTSVETQQRLASAIGTLPPPMREALLSNIDGKSDSQIAASLGISPATVKQYLSRARARLSTWLAVDHESESEAP